MKQARILSLVLCLLILLATVAWAANGNKAASPSGEAASGEAVSAEMPETATEWILSAFSCKSFTDEAVSDELVEQILNAGIQSPSAINTQPCKFILVNNKDIASQLISAPVVVVIAVPVEDYCPGGNSQFAAGVAAEAMYLYAQAAGLGAHMYTAPVSMSINASPEMQADLGLPEGYEAAVVLGFGHYEDYADAVSGASTRNAYDSFVSVIE